MGTQWLGRCDQALDGPLSQEVWLRSAFQLMGLGTFTSLHTPQPRLQGARAAQSSLIGHHKGPPSPQGALEDAHLMAASLVCRRQPSGPRRSSSFTSHRSGQCPGCVYVWGGDRPGAHLDPISLVSQPRRREGNSFPRPAVGQPRCPLPQRGGFPAGPSPLHVALCSFELWSWGQWFTGAGLEPDWPGQKHGTLRNLQPK